MGQKKIKAQAKVTVQGASLVWGGDYSADGVRGQRVTMTR